MVAVKGGVPAWAELQQPVQRGRVQLCKAQVAQVIYERQGRDILV
jgi:hypothetical protein